MPSCEREGCEADGRFGGFCVPHYKEDYARRQREAAEEAAKKDYKEPDIARPAGLEAQIEKEESMSEPGTKDKPEKDPICKWCRQPASANKPFNKELGMHDICVAKDRKAAKDSRMKKIGGEKCSVCGEAAGDGKGGWNEKEGRCRRCKPKKGKAPDLDSPVKASDFESLASMPDERVRKVLDMAFDKYRKGEEKHGVIDLENDPRNFIREAKNELLDNIVYSCFQVEKLDRIERGLKNLLGSGGTDDG